MLQQGPVEASQELGVPFWTLWDIETNGIEAVMREAVEQVTEGCDYLYVSLDLDVIDPAFLPAQKYPDPAGMTAREILRGIRYAIDNGPELIGFDMACLGPDFDFNGLGAQLAARCAVEAIGGYAYRRGSRG